MNPFLPDLTKRIHEPELMDSENADPVKLINTIKQFKVLNHLFTGAKNILTTTIFKDIQTAPQKSFSLLDIGAGGCDIPRWMIDQTRKLGIILSITCLDNDKRIVTYARNACRKYPEITFLEKSAFSLKQVPEFDYMFTNHFLHHLQEKQIDSLIRNISEKTKRIFVLNDIKRSYLSYIGYSLFTALFMKNSFAFYDGRLSIRRGFTINELKTIIQPDFLQHTITFKHFFPSHIAVIGTKENLFGVSKNNYF